MKSGFNDDRFRVVLVEDDLDLRHGLAEYLQLRGFNVTQAGSGAEFRTALAAHTYELAILDVNLPDVNGFDLARAVHLRGNMGIIMLTALRARDHRIKGFEKGADLYFSKPVDSEELALAALNLASRFRKVVKVETEVSETVAGTTGWTLDQTMETLTAPDGTVIHLSARESMLLEFMAARPAILVPRFDLLQMYGGHDADPASRRLDVAFGRLRAKVEQVGLRLPLQAVRGLGLRLTETISVKSR